MIIIYLKIDISIISTHSHQSWLGLGNNGPRGREGVLGAKLKTGHFTSLFNSENLTSLKLAKVQFLCVFWHMGNRIFVAQKNIYEKISKLQFWFD